MTALCLSCSEQAFSGCGESGLSLVVVRRAFPGCSERAFSCCYERAFSGFSEWAFCGCGKRAFSGCSERGLSLVAASGLFPVAASGLSPVAAPGLLIAVASLVAERGLWSTWTQWFWSTGLVVQGIQDLLRPGTEHVSPILAGGFLTTESQNSRRVKWKKENCYKVCYQWMKGEKR